MVLVNRRDSILDAARSEFASAGYAGGRIERVAGSANVNKQLIFHYFRSKDGLYSAVALAAVARFRIPPVHPEPAPAALRLTIGSVMRALEADDMLVAAVVDCAIRAGVPLEVRTAIAGWSAGIQAAVRNVISDGQRQGFFRDDIWPDAVAEHIVNECLGKAVRLIITAAESGDQGRVLSSSKTSVGDWAADYCAWR